MAALADDDRAAPSDATMSHLGANPASVGPDARSRRVLRRHHIHRRWCRCSRRHRDRAPQGRHRPHRPPRSPRRSGRGVQLAAGDEHLRADDIAERLAVAEPGTHRATVYRTLESLVRLGVVDHVHLPHGAATYHLVDTEHEHLHLSCRICGEVIDAPPDLLDDVRRRLDESAGFRLDPHHVALTGWCRACGPG